MQHAQASEISPFDTQGRRRNALITGASSGIGEAFAQVFARNGFNLVLVARREARLHKIAETLKQAYPIEAHVLPADLSRPEAGAAIFAQLAQWDIPIDALVNNAGRGLPGKLRHSPWSAHRDFIELMVTSYVQLAYLAEQQMIPRGYGRIINVASLAGFTPPAAGHTLYNAAKSFIIKFSEAHAEEVRGKGIHVTALCPGFTWSEFHDVSGTRHLVSQYPDYMWMSAAEVAQQGFEAVMAGKTVHIPGRINRTIARLVKYLPDRLARWLTRSQAQKYRLSTRPNKPNQ